MTMSVSTASRSALTASDACRDRWRPSKEKGNVTMPTCAGQPVTAWYHDSARHSERQAGTRLSARELGCWIVAAEVAPENRLFDVHSSVDDITHREDAH